MQDSKIEWCDDTVNGWIGCAKVSAGCTNCYAENLDSRKLFGGRTNWGAGAERLDRSDKAVVEIARIARRAAKEGEPRFVFLSSMCDLFEDRADVIPWRAKVWAALQEANRDELRIVALLLTKRPEVMLAWQREVAPQGLPHWAWVGTSVENQDAADARIPVLLDVAADGIRFLSMEPLLGPVDLENVAAGLRDGFPGSTNALTGIWWPAVGNADREYDGREALPGRIGWVIVGGESGPKARPMHPDWARSLRDQCAIADVPFLFKQWGEWGTDAVNMQTGLAEWPMFDTHLRWVQKASTWVGPADALVDLDGKRCRNGADMQSARYPVAILVLRGKKVAGRVLDGRPHDGRPPADFGWNR